ncbi:hypothetical protein ACLOJK_011276 [Asimina triloba]
MTAANHLLPWAVFLPASVPPNRNVESPKDFKETDYESLQPISPLKHSVIEPAVDHLPESSDKAQHLSFNSRKKVTFDLNVETYIPISAATDEVVDEDGEDGQAKASNGNKRQFFSEEGSNPASLSTSSFPSNHRYQDCEYSSDEGDEEAEEEAEYENSDFEDDDSEGEEESFESYFSRTPLTTKGIEDTRPFGSSSAERQWPVLAKGNVRDRSQYIDSVLNPVENLTQWRAVKAKSAGPLKHEQKENASLELELEPSFKLPGPQIPLEKNVSFNPTKSTNQDFSVNARVGDWLAADENVPAVPDKAVIRLV